MVIEVLDTRLPGYSENPMLAELRGDRPCLKVLNKSDLADPAVTEAWKKHYRLTGAEPLEIVGIGIMWWVLGRMSGGRSGAMGFGRSKAKVSSKEMPEVTFDDVAGEDEAVEELEVPLSYACYSSYPLISITTVICLLPKSATEKHCFFREVKSQCKKNDKIRCYLE